MAEELTAKKRAALNRLKTVRGHLDGIIRMLESDAYCVDVMKQISAMQSALGTHQQGDAAQPLRDLLLARPSSMVGQQWSSTNSSTPSSSVPL